MTAELLSVKKKNDRNFITVECLLVFDKDEDKEKVLNLMRKFSSMVRFAYKRLLEKMERKELKKLLAQKYGINTVFRFRHISGTANSGLLPTKKTKSQKACVWFKGCV